MSSGAWQQRLRDHFAASARAITLRGIPDTRVAPSVTAFQMLSSDGSLQAGKIRAATESAGGEDLNQVLALADELRVELQWQGFNGDGTYDAIFSPHWKSLEKKPESNTEYYRRFANVP